MGSTVPAVGALQALDRFAEDVLALAGLVVGLCVVGFAGGVDEHPADDAEFEVGVGGPASEDREGGVGVDAVMGHQQPFGLFDDRQSRQFLLQVGQFLSRPGLLVDRQDPLG